MSEKKKKLSPETQAAIKEGDRIRKELIGDKPSTSSSTTKKEDKKEK